MTLIKEAHHRRILISRPRPKWKPKWSPTRKWVKYTGECGDLIYFSHLEFAWSRCHFSYEVSSRTSFSPCKIIRLFAPAESMLHWYPVLYVGQSWHKFLTTRLEPWRGQILCLRRGRSEESPDWTWRKYRCWSGWCKILFFSSLFLPTDSLFKYAEHPSSEAYDSMVVVKLALHPGSRISVRDPDPTSVSGTSSAVSSLFFDIPRSCRPLQVHYAQTRCKRQN